MQIILLAFILLVLLAGIAAFAIGHKGWNWGTIAAGVLVLLASVGYTFLAGMLGQRERSWRTIIANYHEQIARERDALVPGGEGMLVDDTEREPIAALRQEKARWLRVLNRIDNWRGRHWNASFMPPGSDKPGMLTLGDVEKLTIHAGAEIYVFDAAPVEENGRFLGGFRADVVNGNAITVTPLAPPTKDDLAAWAQPREDVVVYEELPNDRWLAFHRTATADDAEVDEEGGALPSPQKADPEDLLKHLEESMGEVRQHAESIPEEKWAEIREKLKKREIMPGLYWAQVEFKGAHEFSRPGEEAVQFEEGDLGTFDLETAQSLEDDGKVKIVFIEYRRPLKHGQTALRGGEHEFEVAGQGGADDQKAPGKVRIEGTDFIRRMLQADIAATEKMTAQLKAAKANAEGQVGIHSREADELVDDLKNWQADAKAAERTSDRFDKRVAELSAKLDGTETSIVELGRELDGASAMIFRKIDREAPPPPRRAAAGREVSGK
jgi:hypothetical protein